MNMDDRRSSSSSSVQLPQTFGFSDDDTSSSFSISSSNIATCTRYLLQLTPEMAPLDVDVNGGTLGRLPDELLAQVFEFVADSSKRDLAMVSCLNTRFHTVADAVLYKTVNLLTPEICTLFSETLQSGSRPRRGSAILDIQLAYPLPSKKLRNGTTPSLERKCSKCSPDRLSRRHSAISRLPKPEMPFAGLSNTLSLMSNLEHLNLSVPASLLHDMGRLFSGPFDLQELKTCTLFYQTEDDSYWDLQENIYIFAHPTLETLTIHRATLPEKGFDFIERPHNTALTKLRFIECDINDEVLGDLLAFPAALKEFVLTQPDDPELPELAESSYDFRHYIIALQAACHTLESITIDSPFLYTRHPAAMRDFDKLKELRINWDHQLFGKTSKRPRMHSVALPPNLEMLEFLNELGKDDQVTDLFELAIQTMNYSNQHLTKLIVPDGEKGVPKAIKDACKAQKQITLDIIGRIDESDEEDEEMD